MTAVSRFIALFLTSVFATLAINSYAHAVAGESSSGTRGGGDPQAAEFLEALNDIVRFMNQTGTTIGGVQVFDATKMVDTIRRDMDDSAKTSIQFTEKRLKDESGAEKLALFSTNPLVIQVNRTAWLALDQENRYKLAALELFGLIGLPNRYEAAAALDYELVSRAKHIWRSGWDFDFIYRSGAYIWIDLPHVRLATDPESKRILVAEGGPYSPRTLSIICRLYGLSEYAHAVVRPFDPSVKGAVTLFDTNGFILRKDVVDGDPGLYQTLQAVVCKP